MATVSLLKDCTVTITGGGADDGSYTAGSSDTLKVDQVTLSVEVRTEDHSTAQDLVEQHRIVKQGFEVTIETKLEDATSLGLFQGNDLFTIAVSGAGTGRNFSGVFVITGLEQNYAGPSTLRATFKTYGTAPTFS